MSYLITGGNGFIGFNLATELRALGRYVRIYDIAAMPCTENHEEFLSKLDFEIGGICELDKLKLAMRDTDIVIHLAAISDMTSFNALPYNAMMVNVCGTLNVLKAAVEMGVKRVIFASSAAVYAANTESVNLYGVSKQNAENICNVFRERDGLDVVVLRLFNVYGPGAEKKKELPVINAFIRALFLNIKPVIYGDDQIIRDYIFIDDVVDAIIKATDLENEMVSFKTIDIATGVPITLRDIIYMIFCIVHGDNKKIEYEIGESREGDTKFSKGDKLLLKKYLDYELATSVKEGIERTYEHMKKTFHSWS